MRKVVDHGMLWSIELEDFLSIKTNSIIFTSDCAAESFAGNIDKSFSLLKKFSNQVLVLKNMDSISRLNPRRTGLQHRLIDEFQTEAFANFCKRLPGKSTDSAHVRNLKEKAIIRKDKLLQAASEIRNSIIQRIKSYPPEDLKAIRNHRLSSPQLGTQVTEDILRLTCMTLQSAGFSVPPSPKDIVYSVQFRYHVCTTFLVLHWAEMGGLTSCKDKDIRNSFTDATYAALATFFDGLITKDQLLDKVYKQSRWFLREIVHV